MVIKEGKFSACCFLISTSLILLPILDGIRFPLIKELNSRQNILWFLPCFFIILILCLRRNYSGFMFQVGIRSVFLGMVFSAGIFVVWYSSSEWRLFGVYMCVLAFFHYSEFLAVSCCNPKTLSISSFLLNHSFQYNVAAACSWIEFALEMYFIPDIKKFYSISIVGLILCMIGEALRKTAMITGNTNFAHVVQTEKDENHVLVTHGIYSLCRHPGYVGWFYWSIGTQILLLNPFCTTAYTIVSWRFFKERIMFEENTLLYFFGRDYLHYQKSVGTGLPGIKGFSIE